jgi:hypothetical protein
MAVLKGRPYASPGQRPGRDEQELKSGPEGAAPTYVPQVVVLISPGFSQGWSEAIVVGREAEQADDLAVQRAEFRHQELRFRPTSFRYTGATAKSVLNCENRFSMRGCRR